MLITQRTYVRNTLNTFPIEKTYYTVDAFLQVIGIWFTACVAFKKFVHRLVLLIAMTHTLSVCIPTTNNKYIFHFISKICPLIT